MAYDAIIMAAGGTSNLETGYNKFIGKLFDTTAGTAIKNVMLIAAVVLALCLIIGWACKFAQRQNRLTSQFATPKTTAGTIALIILLTGPTVMFPLLLKLIDAVINYGAGQAPSIVS